MKQTGSYTPLFHQLKAFAQQRPVRFHVPGHKGAAPVDDQAAAYYASLLALDVTELSGLDDLHDAQGVIAEAQSLAAACFHAEQTYFLVNGSTVGNFAMILGSLQPGDQVLVQRNSHKSVFQALALAQAEAIFLQPQLCPIFSVPVGISVQQVEEALQQFPQAKALILTYPNYYGMAFPLEKLLQKAHEHGLLVLVDEAHGAHFGQHSSLPLSAMQLGADACVQSTHKMLFSMTQTSMLHIQGERIKKEDITYFLHSLQSSSPSYPLLASLDLARAQLESMQEQEWQASLQAYAMLREEIASWGSFHLSPAGEVKDHPLGIYQDPFKLVIQARNRAISGYQLQNYLEQAGIYTELADSFNVLCTLPLTVNSEWNKRFLQALKKIGEKEQLNGQMHTYKQSQADKQNLFPSLGDPDREDKQGERLHSISMRVIRAEQKEEVALEQAVQRQAAEMIIPYPPGIPLIVPGEVISPEIIEQIRLLHRRGTSFQGKGYNQVERIAVFK